MSNRYNVDQTQRWKTVCLCWFFDCFDFSVVGLTMDTDGKANILIYWDVICKYSIQQNMNSAGERCYDNTH